MPTFFYREYLIQKVDEDFKKISTQSEESMKILLTVKKIDLFMGVKIN